MTQDGGNRSDRYEVGSSLVVGLPQGDKIVAFWQLEEASGIFVDQTGVNNGTAVGGVTYGQTGKIGKSIRLSESTHGYINCGTNSILIGCDKYTISAWFKYVESHGNNQLWTFNAVGIDDPRIMFNYDGKIVLQLNNVNYRSFSQTSPVNVIDGNWHLITTVITGWGQNDIDNAKVYADGQAQDVVSTVKTGSPKARGLFYIGGGDYSVHGYVDEFIVWNVNLTPAEISTLYAGGTPTRALYTK
ncbi:hypothetical protein COU04_00275 [bacterium (Candidatus Gribaldobacteria) CG10_big_fil_rev_8_21_14_0_10_33_41]|nr:MAG: hypothetical protein COU04_00275 [bacterium (Candidatus Gribaldobacteria) CG10_big_fil_rev_8_21_14_0_10_33_41]